MKFVSFAKNGVETAGVILGDEVADLSICAPELPRTLLGLIQSEKLEEAGRIAADKRKGRHALTSLKYLPLIPHPPKMVNLIRRTSSEFNHPGASISMTTRLCAHLEPMWLPKKTGGLECGIELAVILKKGGRGFGPGDIRELIAGYSVFVGGVVRGLPAGQTVAIARNGDRTAPFGPWLVTPEELPPLASGLRMSLKKNGVIVQEGTTSALWDVAQAVSLISQYMSLEAGDVITLGTLENKSADNGLIPLRLGEILAAEIEHLGCLQNAVGDEP